MITVSEPWEGALTLNLLLILLYTFLALLPHVKYSLIKLKKLKLCYFLLTS